MAFTHLASTFKRTGDEFTTRDSDSFTIPSGCTLLHLMVMNRTTNTSVTAKWRDGGSIDQTISHIYTQTPAAGPYSFFHYQLANPTAGTGTIRLSGVLVYDVAVMLASAVSGDNAGEVRAYATFRDYSVSPRTLSPAGTLSGDYMMGLFQDQEGYTSNLAATGGATQVGTTQSLALGLRKVAGSNGDTIGLTHDGVAISLFGAVSLVPASSPPTLSGPTATATGPTQATIGVTSDTAPTTTAISYQILPAATAAPSAATIVGAPDGTISTGSAGALTKAITGLTTNTAVKVHFAQGASSNVVSSASFTPNTLAIAGTALSAQSGTQGSAFSWSGSTPDSLISNHGNGAGSWSGSGLSGSGLSVNSSTGVLSGTCGAPAVYSATLTYTDSSTVPAAQTVSKAVTVTITALGGGGVTFAGTVPPKTGSAGSAFDFGSPALDSYFTGAGTYAAQSGSLGSIGLSLDANTGVISGATPIAGTQSVVIRKTAASGSPATADTNSFQITIEAAAVSDSGTILLPPVGDLRDGQEITIFSSLAVTALTVSGNGASVNGAPLALAANGYFRLKFNASSLAWYRIG